RQPDRPRQRLRDLHEPPVEPEHGDRRVRQQLRDVRLGHSAISTSYADSSLRAKSRYHASITSGLLTSSRVKISRANATGSVGPAVMRSPAVTASVST